VLRAFHLLEEKGDIVEGKAGLEVPEVPDGRLERHGGGRRTRQQAAAKSVVHDVAKRAIGAARFRLELGIDVIIQGKSCSWHIMMLSTKHHDVKMADRDRRGRAETPRAF
jgi:hypothetical protein